MKRFWNFKESNGDRILYLVGPISEETWFGDEATPALFKADLSAGTGPITVWVNSYGGDVFAAAEIYTALKEYPGKVTVKIDAVAASAASVVAMAGDTVLMSPVAHLIIHNPYTVAIGDSAEMQKAKNTLDAIKDSIINAYEAKTGLRRTQIGHMMTAETDMPAHKAVEMGFADGILYTDTVRQEANYDIPAFMFSRMAVVNSLLDRLPRTPNPADPGPPVPKPPEPAPTPPDPGPPVPTPTTPTPISPAIQPGTTVESLYKRLSLLSH